ncbi:hypothetical protein DSM101010T_12130 [Desulfovibrio subterraneus]|uniref:Uncharacterized protein n=1 Tax=Desulfovibrio subterraneus TaxID=2718620 RepID=A0A7J0BH08_9BACT|nr:hypothetical protein DSM101010T_12130 [Desulfovibrio subterraneus]
MCAKLHKRIGSSAVQQAENACPFPKGDRFPAMKVLQQFGLIVQTCLGCELRAGEG